MNRGSFDEYARRLKRVDWFAKVGWPSSGYEVAAADWAAAGVMVDSDAFGDQKMNAQNALSNYLFHNHIEADRLWNEVTKLAREKIDAEKQKVLDAIKAGAEERQKVWGRCRAILTLAFSEAWYSGLAPAEMRFGRECFAAFEAGRLPCGYAGEFPRGQFRVY